MNKILFFFIHYFQILYVIVFEILSIFCGIFCIFLSVFFYNTYKKVKYILKDILPENILNNKSINELDNYIPKTGDIYLGQWRESIPTCFIETVRYYPTHVGFIWNRKKTLPGEDCALQEEHNVDTTYIVEINHFRRLKNCLKSTSHLNKGLCVIEMKPFFEKMKGIVYIRKTENEIDSNKIERALLDYCSDITFDPRISSMTVDSTVGVGWKPVFPYVSDIFMHKLKFYEKQYKGKQFFCSEFLAWFFEVLGQVRVPHGQYFQISPGCFLSTTQTIEKISINNKWKKEFILLKNF